MLGVIKTNLCCV